MNGKLFTLDKNYLLKEAQLQQKDQLLLELVIRAKNIYLHDHNPLGLVDDVIEKLMSVTRPRYECLLNFYFELAGIYRFKFGENQLEFLFDGTPHLKKYGKDWHRQFRIWTGHFCEHKHFLRAVLEGSILNVGARTDRLVEARLKIFLEQYFGLRIYKYRGIRKILFACRDSA